MLKYGRHIRLGLLNVSYSELLLLLLMMMMVQMRLAARPLL
jgi:hypothetical protein